MMLPRSRQQRYAVCSTMLIKQRNRLFRLPVPPSLRLVYVWGKGVALFANKKYQKGDRIIVLKGTPVHAANATPEAIQISRTKFLDTKYLCPEDFINHSCSPNTTLDLVVRWVVATKDIPRHTEITFNYLTTEWDMQRWGTDFRCRCGSRQCFGHVRGFKYLTRAEKQKLKPFLSPWLLHMFA